MFDSFIANPTNYSPPAPGSRTLIEHWDGKSWQIVPTPNPGDQGDQLVDVAIVSASDVWAVGCYGKNQKEMVGTGITLVVHWDGSKWEQVPSPNVQTYSTCLSGLAVLSATEIWAVGSTNNGEGGAPVSMHWDGTKWSIVPSPTTNAHNGTGLSAVAPISSPELWAVGVSSPGPYILRWDGSDWSQVAVPFQMPDGTPFLGGLTSIVTISPTEAWAIGSTPQGTTSSGNMLMSYILHYGPLPQPCGTPGP